MNVNQVSFTGAQAKKPMSKGKKVAITAGAVLATAATAATIAAGVIGGKKTPDAKLLAKLGTGFGAMGSFVAQKATATGSWVGKKAQTVGEWIGKKASDAGKAIEKTFHNLVAKLGTTAEEAATLADESKLV